MTKPFMRLCSCNFTKVHLDVLVGEQDEKLVYPLQTRVDFVLKKGTNQYLVILGVRKGSDDVSLKSPVYSFTIEMVGLFELDKKLLEADKKHAEEMFRVNAPSLLFGSARELILQLTSRSVVGPYILPTVAFLDLKDKTIREEA